MDSINFIIVFLTCTAAFIFATATSAILWFLSKKYPNAWYLNKVFVVTVLVFTTPVALGIIVKRFTDKFPSSVFEKHFGFPPTSDVKDLQVSFEQKGDNYFERLNFKADKETVNKMLGRCFYKTPQSRVEDFGDEKSREFLENQQVYYYEKPGRDVEETNCIGDFSYSFIAYDETSGNVYYYWQWSDF